MSSVNTLAGPYSTLGLLADSVAPDEVEAILNKSVDDFLDAVLSMSGATFQMFMANLDFQNRVQSVMRMKQANNLIQYVSDGPERVKKWAESALIVGNKTVAYDQTCKDMFSVLETISKGGKLPGTNRTVDELFDTEKLSKFRAIYQDPALQSVLKKVENGQELTPDELTKLRNCVLDSFHGVLSTVDGKTLTVDYCSTTAQQEVERNKRVADSLREMITRYIAW